MQVYVWQRLGQGLLRQRLLGKLRQILTELAPWRSSKTRSDRDEGDPWSRRSV